jgi:DNA-binding MarR family transcriptional regulator
MYEQHYRAENYKAQNSVGYLIKRAHSMMLDVVEPVLEEHGYSYIQYVISSSLRDGMAVNRKDIRVQFRHNSGALTRVLDQLAEHGLLKRIRRGRDRGKVELQLAAAGRKAVSYRQFPNTSIQSREILWSRLFPLIELGVPAALMRPSHPHRLSRVLSIMYDHIAMQVVQLCLGAMISPPAI